MHPRLLGVLRTFNPHIPSDASPADAWKMIKPEGVNFLRGSFWAVLSQKMPFCKSDARQKELAEYIWKYKTREQAAGRTWPPMAIKVKPAILPQPSTQHG